MKQLYTRCAGIVALVVITSFSLFTDEGPDVVGITKVAGDFMGPVAMGCPADGSGRLFVCEQTGKIKIVEANKIAPRVFIDLSKKIDKGSKFYSEKGLLGLAFHPMYKRNGKFYVYYSAPSKMKDNDHKSIVAEYKVSADKDVADPASEKIIMEIEQPESNHNGGQLAFGPDGYLYIGLGDGGGANDEHGAKGNGQNLGTVLGKILRIDVNVGVESKDKYSIPGSNPWAGSKSVRREIWAYGLRNPWRFSFDKATGKLFCADVGQNKWEEINIITRGANYGWRIMEAKHCFNPAAGCNESGLMLPVAEYDHETGISVTGGFVYRGNALKYMQGKYIFGDWKGKLFYLDEKAGRWTMHTLPVNGKEGNDIESNINSFGEDEHGEVYILAQKFTGTVVANGALYKIIPR